MRRSLNVETGRLAYGRPLRISGYAFTDIEVVVATISQGGARGRGEAAGVYFVGETAESMAAEIEAMRDAIEGGITRHELLQAMQAGGARNAVDCALWEFEAALAGTTVWHLAGLDRPVPLVTVFTLGAEDPAIMAEGARGFAQARALKLKLSGEAELDAERVRAVRRARPDAWLSVDANQGYQVDALDGLFALLKENNVALLEQPLARGREADLDQVRRPVPVAADESVLDSGDIESLVGRFDMINIKLDKCGGLTEALAMEAGARRLGLDVMVGNMGGSSLAMAPAFVLGQRCNVADLDGPTFLARDCSPGIEYQDGMAWCPDTLWGSREAGA